MASDIARLGRAGVAGLPGSKSQAQIFLQRSLSLSVARAEGRGSGILFTSFENDRKRASVQSMRRLAPGRRGGGFEHHAPILPEAVRVAIYQYELQFAAGPAGDVPPAASSPLETAAAPGRDPGGAKRNSLSLRSRMRARRARPLGHRQCAAPKRSCALIRNGKSTPSIWRSAAFGAKSPNQVAAEWDGGDAANGAATIWRGENAAARNDERRGKVKKIGDERALALLAEHAVRRRIGREGIALERARFVAVELDAYVGRDVTVFPDPSGDMGVVHVFLQTRAGREFLCRAVNVERLGLDHSNLAIRAHQAQNRYIPNIK